MDYKIISTMLRLIAAVDAKLGLYKDGERPWFLPGYDEWFDEHTKSHGGVVLMSDYYYKHQAGEPLKDRRNLVLTGYPKELIGVETFSNLHTALNAARDVWVIGGDELYEKTIEIADELYLAEIDKDFSCDRFFPDFSERFGQSECGEDRRHNNLEYKFCVYKRRTG